MSTVTTHVLDTTRGRPAAGIAVSLESGPPWTPIAAGTTDEDGRIRELGPDHLEAGDYRLTFDTGEHFARTGTDSFFPQVQITFRITDPTQHHHVPLLLSPFSYSTYRGS